MGVYRLQGNRIDDFLINPIDTFSSWIGIDADLNYSPNLKPSNEVPISSSVIPIYLLVIV